ncbi:alkaline phosphatase family protein [Phycicoccus endophyticus]|uniref:Alkaline phosphatase family protein n=1 Tax=Phycicoccus endophyticus TaxID=1690220 RepID=A0A7G9R1Z6_9MICO|nr:alkaline phosphatase family protein [Phycicoccus endophyticus]NHI19748.1 alkaline phosphatase family protein [Phycicoccus endophyticus]QNN49621.1 alkaline phosphatase family protein [Phycicoccus endophyticus]GGL33406.1 membrane protein [Phycicoccus endophyticus]
MADTVRPRVLRWGDLGRLLAAWGVGTGALWVSGVVLPGLSADGWWAWPTAAAVVGVVGALLRPLLVLAAALVGWVAVVVVAFVGQAVVLHVALGLVPGVRSASFGTTLVAAWVTAALVTAVEWLTTAGTSDSLVASLAREVGSRSRGVTLPDPEVRGVIFVQLDGLPFPLLRWALQSGLMPTVRRWVDSGTHVAQEWLVQLPCTTPASQLGLLHGTTSGVPAFRWYDRELGRVLVANRPADARIIEDRVRTGHGLLADDGASVSNLFSGDAPRCSMVMSRTEASRGSLATRRAVSGFVARPDGLARTLARAVAEIGRERFQSRRQRRRDVVPRIVRPWAFTGLRAATNGLLRDVNLVVVARELAAGRRSVYVDFVDYDEVAHHAGPTRLEALAVLAEIDGVVEALARLADLAPRRYEILLLSDHGQSMGEPFESRHGIGLDELCRGLMGTDVTWVGEPVESVGRAASLAEDLGEAEGGSGLTDALVRRGRDLQDTGTAAVGTPVVLGSGNLGLLYAGGRRRLTLPELDDRWPRLTRGLAEHPGIGWVAGLSHEGRSVALGARGWRDLTSGAGDGEDPFENLPAHSGRMLASALADDRAPDLYVGSSPDPSTGEVAAFEDLVGSHGGLGGWQDRGVVVAPTSLWRGETAIEGAAALHRALVAVLEEAGHRRDLGACRPETAEALR